MSEIKKAGTVKTNATSNSIAKIQHGEPEITLLGRVAAGVFGYVGYLSSGGAPSLHFTLEIKDSYSGIIGIDGQPTFDVHPHPVITAYNFDLFRKIRVNFYRTQMPAGVVIRIPIKPPGDMSTHALSQKIIRNAHNFASYTADYSPPKHVSGAVMNENEYNSSSFISGLLNSALGFVPKINASGYQTPGWETPIPASYFKGEALR